MFKLALSGVKESTRRFYFELLLISLPYLGFRRNGGSIHCRAISTAWPINTRTRFAGKLESFSSILDIKKSRQVIEFLSAHSFGAFSAIYIYSEALKLCPILERFTSSKFKPKLSQAMFDPAKRYQWPNIVVRCS